MPDVDRQQQQLRRNDVNGNVRLSSQNLAGPKDDIKVVLMGCAHSQKTIAYSELVEKIKAIDLQSHDPRLDELLGQISNEEAGHGRGMLSVLVVHKTGDLRPGRGFYECARALGFDTSDEDRLWVDQLNIVYTSWAKISGA